MKYIIYLGYWDRYFSGRTYRYGGETYAIEASEDTAKRYKSRKVAERVAERVSTMANCLMDPAGEVKVIEVDG